MKRLFKIFSIIVLVGILSVLLIVVRFRKQYSGVLKELTGTAPAIDYYTYTNLPSLSNKQKDKYCKMSVDEKETYYQAKLTEAKELSDKLENYIRLWYAGKAEAKLPKGLLPDSIDNEKTKDWTLLRPEEVKAENQWYSRLANEVPADFSKLYFLGPDNHVTYLKLVFTAPLDSQLLIEGDFPHARFMDYQILEPFDPENPTTSGMGAPEVPIVDVDIEPDPSHTNPFRPGADRNATNRHYHLTFDLKAGNALKLNPQAMIAPAYRAPGNSRVGGPFAFAGPIGDGQIVASVLWLRYYAPDKGVGPLAGASLPKALLRLKTGETFWLQSDFSLASQRQNVAVPGFYTSPEEPKKYLGSTVGWFKMFSFWLAVADGYAYSLVKPWGPIPKSWATNFIRSKDQCFFSRGANQPPPGNHEIQASGMNYDSYLFRVVSLGKEKIYALTGKLPKTPKTRNGEPTATIGEARYWSITHSADAGENGQYKSLLYGSLMDDEITTDEKENFLVVYSRGNERPANAKPECGVTWQDFGPQSRQAFVIRWMSVMPDDYLPEFAPHQNNITWETGEWSSPDWDPKIMSYNNQEGFMKEYQPLLHYLTKSEFEALGCPIEPQKVPKWK